MKRINVDAASVIDLLTSRQRTGKGVQLQAHELELILRELQARADARSRFGLDRPASEVPTMWRLLYLALSLRIEATGKWQRFTRDELQAAMAMQTTVAHDKEGIVVRAQHEGAPTF